MSSMRSGLRPLSANPPSQSRQNIAKAFSDKVNTNSVDNVAKIWTAFGKYVEKVLKSGKGVAIPKFGQFTFTPIKVDLAGSTNPSDRDKQLREPIFQVARDFVLGLDVRAGVVLDNGVIRTFEIKGTSGIVPKVRINYTEIGIYAGVSKEDAKHGCDIVIRDLSDKVKSGQPAKLLIPNVGTFVCKNSAAGVWFTNGIKMETLGKTAKTHFIGKLFSSSVNRANLDLLDQKVSEGIRTRITNFNQPSRRIPVIAKPDNTITVTNDAENWLKRNLGVTLDDGAPADLKSTASKHRMKRTFSARPGFRSTDSEQQTSVKSEQIDHFQFRREHEDKPFVIKSGANKKRPMSAYSGGSRASRASSVKSAASAVPKMTRATALDYCNRIATKALLDYVQANGISARDKLSPTELQSILVHSGIRIEIATVRGLLNHLGFNPHGKACSILDLIRTCKDWNSKSQPIRPFEAASKAQSSSVCSVDELILKIRDCFYKSGKDIKHIFEAGSTEGGYIDEEAFVFVCKKFCYPSITETDSRKVFNAAHKNVGSNLYFNDFRNIFSSIQPKNNFHIEGLKLIRDWMYTNGLTSDQVFEVFSAGKDKFNLEHFEGQLKKLFNLTSPEVEAIFRAIDDNCDGFIDSEEWLSKVYEDSNNPLQMLREVVNEHNLDSDDLLFKMNLRIWDDPLDFPKFASALRVLDSSLTDLQLKAVAKSMKNSQNLVEVPVLIRNLVGKDYETVDFRDKLYKRVYSSIYGSNDDKKIEKFRNLLIKYDSLNDGTIVAQDLNKVLAQVCSGIKSNDIERFTRFIDKDVRGRINYTQFIDNLESVKNHNPFKNLMNRIKAFMTQNNQNVDSFMRRLTLGESQSAYSGFEDNTVDKERKVSVEFFAKFLKNKVDKKKSLDELLQQADLIDVDRDGCISIHDLQSCLGNLSNETFYKNNGATLKGTFKTILTEREKFFPKEPLPDTKALEVIAKIKEALIAKGISFRELFARLDSNNDEFLTFAEFSQNIEPIIKLSPLVKEQLFALMDVNKIGMIDYESFLSTLKKTAVSAKVIRVNDNFNWEYEMIQKIKDWISSEGITVEEAFKAFDRDFDGFIDIEDLKWVLINIVKCGDKSSIKSSQLERLFKLLDFHKDGYIQKCDLQRLMENENPYLTTGKSLNTKFMVGSDTFDWKNNAIQQIGIVLSKSSKFSSLQECFSAVSQGLGKVRYREFKEFIEDNNALKGFNLTDQLLQQLFSEIDPHKKGFLTESDWNAAFGGFDWHEQLVVELQNLVACSFTDIESAYDYFQVIGTNKEIDKNCFISAVNSLRGTKLKEPESRYLWKYFSDGYQVISHDMFCSGIGNVRFSGKSTLRKTSKYIHSTTLVSETTSSSTWSVNVMEKFRKIIKSSNMHLREIFESFDEDGNGFITPIEFRNAVRKLQINLSAKEIDEIIRAVDRNLDGMIDWLEFSAKFKTKDNERLIETRTKNKMAKLKEQMTLHMKTPQDAFELFDKSKAGKLSFANFNDLIKELSSLSKQEVPPFAIIKDLFDEIDIRKDGEIDFKEWNQTFIAVQDGDKKFSLKKMPIHLAEFEVSRDAKIIHDAIVRNRKYLMDKFREVSADGDLVSFDDAKEIIRSVQRGKEIEDEQYKILFKGAIKDSNMVEFKKLGKSINTKFA